MMIIITNRERLLKPFPISIALGNIPLMKGAYYEKYHCHIKEDIPSSRGIFKEEYK